MPAEPEPLKPWEKWPTWTRSNDPTFFRTPAHCRPLGRDREAFIALVVSKVKHTKRPYWWVKVQKMTWDEWKARSLHLNRLAIEVYLRRKYLAEQGLEFGVHRVMTRFNVGRRQATDALARGEDLFMDHWRRGKFSGITGFPPWPEGVVEPEPDPTLTES